MRSDDPKVMHPTPSDIFRPHGSLSCVREGQIIRVDAAGPFNVEYMQRMLEVSGPLMASAISDGPIALLTEFHESMMMGPDVLRAMATAVAAARQQGWRQVGIAYVADAHVEGRDLMLPMIEREVFLPGTAPFLAFETVEPARAWLETRLAAVAR